jgi:hypothetical protein
VIGIKVLPGALRQHKYSLAASAVGRPVEVQAYADRIVIRQDEGSLQSTHDLSDAARRLTRHYVPGTRHRRTAAAAAGSAVQALQPRRVIDLTEVIRPRDRQIDVLQGVVAAVRPKMDKTQAGTGRRRRAKPASKREAKSDCIKYVNPRARMRIRLIQPGNRNHRAGATLLHGCLSASSQIIHLARRSRPRDAGFFRAIGTGRRCRHWSHGGISLQVGPSMGPATFLCPRSLGFLSLRVECVGVIRHQACQNLSTRMTTPSWTSGRLARLARDR